jgi:26S proteasome regulatory subunit N1
MRIALKINDPELIASVMATCTDPIDLKQVGYLLGRHKYYYEVDDDDLIRIISNEHLNESFNRLATDLDVMEVKTPEDIYKSHLEEHHGRRHHATIESEKTNLAASFVNAFVNVGFCNTINADEE